MKNESAENIVTIVSLLAKCGVPNLLHPPDRGTLKMKVEALMQDDADPFVREVLTALEEGKAVLAPDVLQALRQKY